MLRSAQRHLKLGSQALVGLALLGVAATYLLSPLNGNLRYEAGVKIVGTFSAAGTFSHRPLGFRLLMDGVFGLADLVSVGTVSFEVAVRIILALLAVGAGVLLWRGLAARRMSEAPWLAAVALGALLMVGPVNTGEPDWMAVLLACAGIGAALLGTRRPWLWAVVAGVLLVAAAAMKIISLPTALVGLGVVAAFDARQALRTMGAATTVGLAYLGATVLWAPWELQWLLDIGTVQKSFVAGLTDDAVPYFARLAWHRPVLVLVPAALILLPRRPRLAALAALALTTGMIVLQGQYFAYHAAALLVLAAVVVFRALAGRVGPSVGAAVAALVAGAGAMTAASSGWIGNHERLWGGVLIGSALAGAVWAVAVRRRPPRGGRRQLPAAALAALTALTVLALLYPGCTPWAAQLLPQAGERAASVPTVLAQRAHAQTVARRVHEVVGGPRTPVTYLTFGEWTYFIRNPTTCRYPSPLFLQRTRFSDRAVDTPSFRESLSCLRAPDSRWLIVDPTWFVIGRSHEQVRTVIAREWDCEDSVAVAELRLCSRRGSGR